MNTISRSLVWGASRCSVARARSSLIMVGALVLAFCPARLQAATETWDGGHGSSAFWFANLNWADDTAPTDGDDLVFAGTTRLSHSSYGTDGDGDLQLLGIVFDATAGAFVISDGGGGTIMLQGNIVNNDADLQTINFPFQLNGGDRTIDTASGNIRIGGVISEDASARGLTKDGSSTLTLNSTAANTYSGGTTINTGILSLGTGGGLSSHQDALGTGSVTVNSGGQLRLWIENSGSFTIDNTVTLDGGTIHAEDGVYDITAAVSLDSASTLSARWGNKDLEISGVIAGAGSLTIDRINGSNGGAVIFSGANTYSGNTTINASGLLELRAADVIPDGSGKGDVTVTGTLDLNTFSETINGLSGAGTVDTIAGGTPTLTVGNDDDTNTFSGTLQDTAGALALTKVGTGTQSLSGTARKGYVGATTINGGTLELSGGLQGASVVTIDGASSTLQLLGNVNNMFLDNTISIQNGGTLDDATTGFNVHSMGTITFTNGGILTASHVSPNGTFGDYFIKGGVNVAGNAAATISATEMSLNGTQTFDVEDVTGDSGTDLTVSTEINEFGSGALLKEGAGTMALTAANTYDDGTTVNDGTLDLVGQNRITGAVVVDGSGIVKLSGTSHNAMNNLPLTMQNGGTFTDDTTGNFVQSVGAAVTFNNGGTMTSEAGANGAGGFGNYVFNGPGISVTGSGLATISANGMSFGFDETVTVADTVAGAGTDLLISSIIQNNWVGTVTKAGAGTLEMTGVNTDTSPFNITGGTLKIGGAGQLNSGSYASTIGNAGTFEYNSSAAQALSGVISGIGNLVKDNTGTLTLNSTAANTYSGGTTIDDGILSLGTGGGLTSHQDALGSGSVTVNSGGQLRLWIENSGSFTIDNTVTLDGGTIHAEDGVYDITAAVSLDSASTLSARWGNKDLEISGVIAGAGSLTIDRINGSNGGAVIFSGANTYSGNTTINASGLLELRAADVIPDGTGKGDVTLTGTLDLNTYSETINGLSGAGTVDTIAGGTPTLTVGNDDDTTTFSGTLQDTAGTLSFVKTGSGTQTMTGPTAYSGTTTVNGGTLILHAPSAFYDYKGGQFNINNTGSTLRVQNSYFFQNDTFVFGSNGGGNLDIGSGNNVFRADNAFTTLGGSQNTITQSSTFGLNCDNFGTRTFNVADGSDSVDLLISAVIANNGSVAKEGAGTMAFTNAQTYTGGTVVDAGVLQVINASGSGTGSGAVNVNAGATVGGTGSMDGLVTVASTGHIAPGTSIGTITMAGGLTLNDGSILDIEADSLGAADRIDITGGTFTGAASAGGVTVNVTFSGTPQQGAYVLMDWSAATESGVDLADFDLALTAPAAGIHELIVANDQLLLSVVTGTVFMFQ